MDAATLIDVDVTFVLPDDFRVDELDLAAILVAVVGDLQTALRKGHPAPLAGVVVYRAPLTDVPAQNDHLEDFVAINQATGISVRFPDQVRVEFRDRDPAVGYRFQNSSIRKFFFRDGTQSSDESLKTHCGDHRTSVTKKMTRPELSPDQNTRISPIRDRRSKPALLPLLLAVQTVASLAVVPVEVEASFRDNPPSDDITNVVLLKQLVGDVGGTH